MYYWPGYEQIVAPGAVFCCVAAALSVVIYEDSTSALRFLLSCAVGLVLYYLINAAGTYGVGAQEQNRREWEERLKESDNLVRSCLKDQEDSDLLAGERQEARLSADQARQRTEARQEKAKRRNKLSPIELLEKYKDAPGRTETIKINERITETKIKCPEQCPICADDMIDSGTLLKTPCNHIAHTDCLNDWVLHRDECPTCTSLLLP
jgi:hypothetical protein